MIVILTTVFLGGIMGFLLKFLLNLSKKNYYNDNT